MTSLALLAGLILSQGAAPFFATPLSLDDMRGKQAVIDTASGQIVIELLPDTAPNHVGYFIELARQGAYDGTTFHRAIKYGILQGGDPFSKDPARRAEYGRGGLGHLRGEPGAVALARSAVAAVLQPGKRDSAGAQFFIAVTDQRQLDGQYTVFGRVVEGMDVVQTISAMPLDAEGRAVDRVEMSRVTIRDTPPPEVEPFSTEPVADLARYRATLETSQGPITLEFLPDKAPTHVRAFLRLASAGVFDGTSFHRVVKGFVIQTGSLDSRPTTLTEKQQKLVRPLEGEFNDTAHVKGVVSMARGEDPNSATTSFFICTATTPALDGKYTAFGRVVDGMAVVEAIEAAPVDGEAPRTRIDLVKVRLERP